MKKILLLFICIILLSGCSAKANTTVLSDGQVIETILLSQDKSKLYGDINTEEIVKNYIDIYQDMLSGYTYEDVSTENELKFKIEKKFNDICSYAKNSSFVKMGANDVDCNLKDNKYNLSADVSLFNCDDGCMEPPVIDELEYKLNSNEKIIWSNALEKTDNLNTWKLNGETSNSLKFTINESKSKNININNKNTVIYFVLSFIVLMILITFVLFKKYKKNRLEF